MYFEGVKAQPGVFLCKKILAQRLLYIPVILSRSKMSNENGVKKIKRHDPGHITEDDSEGENEPSMSDLYHLLKKNLRTLKKNTSQLTRMNER